MNETVILVSLIIGFFAVTIVALVGAILVRRREQGHDQDRQMSDTIEQLDAALDTAMTEINKMGSLVQKEITEKYQAMLFLYNLLEDKQKEMTGNTPTATKMPVPMPVVPILSSAKAKAAPTAKVTPPAKQDNTDSYLETLAERTSSADPMAITTPPLVPATRPSFANPKHEAVWERHYVGHSIADIAKDLGIGQGEVKLIIDLAARA